ncbi:MAG: N-acetyl-D-Glu racemase DgcA [Elstera sp.]
MGISLSVAAESWPIAGSFTISRGSRTEARVVVATVHLNGATGRGECVPYPRYGESVEGVLELIQAQTEWLATQTSATQARLGLLNRLKPGAARNALDCALWDLEAKQFKAPVWKLAGLPAPAEAVTAYTLSLGTPESMQEAAAKAAHRPLLKVKLGGAGDPERIAAVRAGAPTSTLIVDANEAWTDDLLEPCLAACRAVGVALIEQPLPAGRDEALTGLDAGILLCADESVHDRSTLDALATRYQAINIKLDKTGGLTEAIAMAEAAEARGLKLMIGCMVGTSLAMAPALLLAGKASYVDLDGPLLLAKDRDPGLSFTGSTISPAPAALWG